jgi:hypothetical protein
MISIRMLSSLGRTSRQLHVLPSGARLLVLICVYSYLAIIECAVLNRSRQVHHDKQ